MTAINILKATMNVIIWKKRKHDGRKLSNTIFILKMVLKAKTKKKLRKSPVTFGK